MDSVWRTASKCLFVLLAVGWEVSVEAQVPVFDGPWTALTDETNVLFDSNSDVVSDERNIVGAAASASAYVSRDEVFLYFKLRLDESPGSGTLSNFSWGCQIDTDGNASNSWEFIAIAVGKNPSGVYLQQNNTKVPMACDGSSGCPAGTFTWNVNELAETQVTTSPLPYPLLTFTNTAIAETALNGDQDYYLHWAVALEELQIPDGRLLRFACGTNANGDAALTTGSSGDVVGLFPFYSDALVCDSFGCALCAYQASGGGDCPVFVDGFEADSG